MGSRDINRREFVGLTTAGIAGGVLGITASSWAEADHEGWDPDQAPICTGRPLTVQPILMYRVAQRRPAASWKSWGGVQSDAAAVEETQRITQELKALSARPSFPVKILPVVAVKSAAEAARVHENDYDCAAVYAATGSGELLGACLAPKRDRDTIVFVRHRSGPAYYWYEALSTRFLQTDDVVGQAPTYSARHRRPVHVDDVVVDDYDEMYWRLRALYGLKNFVGARIVALGGPWGKYAPDAPQVARDQYGLQIIDVPYDEAAPRIRRALEDREAVAQASHWADRYLALPDTKVMTDRQFVTNAFVLYGVFKDLMREHDAPAFTIRGCMGTVLPIAQTTPCLSLSLLNDEGLMAFCESDFVIIPAGILLHYISGTPVFLHNSTFPHQGIVTCAHCSAPRRLDGTRYEPVKVMTHYESEYGAAPKVEMPLGRQVTFIDPEYSTARWLGFTGIVKSNPLYEVCRSQQDVEIQGDWKRLINEVRDSHWMMVYGHHLREIAYATRKIGIEWIDLSST